MRGRHGHEHGERPIYMYARTRTQAYTWAQDGMANYTKKNRSVCALFSEKT